MNQNRWTCLATVVLTTVIGPIANVHASTLSSPVGRAMDKYVPVSPQSLPTITPLVVTEIDTNAVISETIEPVPQVSKLPTVTPLNRKTTASSRSKKQRIARPIPQSTVAKQPLANPIFNADVRITDPTFQVSKPTNRVAAVVNQVVPLPKPQVFTTPTTTATVGTIKIDKLQANSLLQASPIIGEIKYPISQGLRQGSDLPSFESGVPVFGINNDRTSQIIVTAIAQVGDTIVSPEPSIAIPVETQKSKNPSNLPASVLPTVTINQPATTIKPTLDKIVAVQSGQASWYGSEAGSKTANGEKYNPNGLTAAHRTLPFGTKVRVTSLKTGKTVTVRINDRGPFHSRRIIDVSAGAAKVIGIKNDGIGDVRMEVLDREG
jgi:rare lipoprotein A